MSLGKPKPIQICALLDSGSSSSILFKDLGIKLQTKTTKPTEWQTQASQFKTTKKGKVQFMLPQFSDGKVIETEMYFSAQNSNYDMIIGRDLLNKLKIQMDFGDMTITWDYAIVPMQPREVTVQEMHNMTDSESMQDTTERMKSILDAKYEAVDLLK